MKLHLNQHEYHDFNKFRINCGNCSGLCCAALYFSRYDGFPYDKKAGEPCRCLDGNFRCLIHGELGSKKLKGCLSYDCCGAGPITADLYPGVDWKSAPDKAGEIFDVFVKTFYLQQIQWYLTEILYLLPAEPLWEESRILILGLHSLLHSSPKEILEFDTENLKLKVNPLFKNTIKFVKMKVNHSNITPRKTNLIAHNFQNTVLDGVDFSSSLLIAANLEGCRLTGSCLLGADLRDANIKNADLSECIFLTQNQLNTAAGNSKTRIPGHLLRPLTWKKQAGATIPY